VTIQVVPQNPTDTPTLEDQRRQYVYFVDGMNLSTNADVGNMVGDIFTHTARSNVLLTPPFEEMIVRRGLDRGGAIFAPEGPLMSDGAHRYPIFWDTQELAGVQNQICVIGAQNNVLAVQYRMRAFGRYYDRQVLSNRSFGRLISPPPIVPFG
jgi:hypothetical protein